MDAHAVTDFKTEDEGRSFIESLEAGVRGRQKDFERGRFPMTFGPLIVEVWSLDALGAAAFAARRNSVARPTDITYFLSEGAVAACAELGLEFLDLGGSDKEIPREAKQILKAEFRTTEPHARITPS